MIQEGINENIDSVKLCKTSFYQCDFNSVIQLVDKHLKQENNLSSIQKLVHLKVKALFELNRREEAMKVLEEKTISFQMSSNADTHYALGSLEYFKGNFKEALTEFQKMLEFKNSKESSFLALLSVANVHYSLGDLEQAAIYMDELSKYVSELEPEYQMSHELLKANTLSAMKKDLNLAVDIYESVYQKAITLNWNYFAQKSLYYLAKLNVLKNEKETAVGILKVLDMYLKAKDWRFMSTLVSDEFRKINFISSQKVEVDAKTKSLIVGSVDKYKVEFGRWPNLFKLLNTLYEKKGFVSKASIAMELWPGQKYLPKTHDARIYDLVSRLKKQIEVCTDVSLLIEVKDGGYRLNY